MVGAGPGQVLDRLSEIAAVRLGAAFAGRPDQRDREARFERHGHQGGLAVARDAFDPDAPCVHRGQRLEIVERTSRAPRPGAQRSPLLGRPAPALVGEPDDAGGQPSAVVGLDAAGVERNVTPARCDELVGRGRSGGLLESREPRQHLAGHVAPAEHHQHRNRALGMDGHDDGHLDLDRNRRIGGVVDVPDHPPGHDRLAADRGLHRLGDRPGDPRNLGRHAAVDLALEVLHDLRASLLPPLLGGRDLVAVLQRQQLRPVRVGVGPGRIVVRRVRCTCGGAPVGAWPKPHDAEPLHHVGVVLARHSIQPRAFLGAEQERVGRSGCGLCRRRQHLRRKPPGQEARAEEKEDSSCAWHDRRLR